VPFSLTAAQIVLAAPGAAVLLAWVAVALRPGRFWDLRPVVEDQPRPPAPARWPTVTVLLPARNEAARLRDSLPALMAQDYPGEWRIVLIDDRSEDGTGAIARDLTNGRATIVEGGPLPEGWAGKVWALQQGAAAAGEPDYLWLTDADIVHAPGVLTRLVSESGAAGLAMNSVMARLSTGPPSERFLVPAFLFFFNLLYPMRLVNGSGPTAAAAGGCLLVRRDRLERIGGFGAIRGEVIDDIGLARLFKGPGAPIRLAVSRAEVVSVRRYDSLSAFWRTVRRTAFAELRHSWARLIATVAGLLLAFGTPPVLLVVGAAGMQAGLAALGLAGWVVMTLVYAPTVRFFGLPIAWALTLPLAGLLYGGMTVDSALQHVAGRRRVW
jgi:hopene-associated glycosyltransferase HpnB